LDTGIKKADFLSAIEAFQNQFTRYKARKNASVTGILVNCSKIGSFR